MSKLNFDPSNSIKMATFIDDLNTVESVLENSKPIYFNPIASGQSKLIRTVLYGSMTMESLSHQLSRLDSMMEVTLENAIPLEESTQVFMVDMAKLLTHRIELETSPSYISESTFLELYRNSTTDSNHEVTRINQYEFEDVILNENTSRLKDLLTVIENDTLDVICIDSLQFLISVAVEGMIDVDKASSVICDKVSSVCDQSIQCNYLETWESLQAVNSLICKFDSIYSLAGELNFNGTDRISRYGCIKTNLLNTMEEIKKGIVSTHPLHESVTAPVFETMILSCINDINMATTESDMIQALNEFSRLQTVCEFYGDDILLEAKRHGGNRRKVASTIARRSKKVMTKTAKGAQKAGSAVKTSKKKIYDPMEKFIENTFDKIKNADSNARKDIIIKGGVIPKVLRFVRRGIAIGAVGVVSPTIAGISLLTYIALDKSLDKKARRKVLTELEQELEMVTEKIEDSKGDEDKQKKYELMRIKQKLEKDINKIRHGIE